MKTAIGLFIFALCGCAAAPIGEIPEAELKACEAVADEYDRAVRVAQKTVIGAIKGWGSAQIALEFSKALGGAVSATNTFVAAIALFGFLDGLLETADRRAGIVRQCLRDRDVKAY